VQFPCQTAENLWFSVAGEAKTEFSALVRAAVLMSLQYHRAEILSSAENEGIGVHFHIPGNYKVLEEFLTAEDGQCAERIA
jgi:hypothetical protein